MIERAGWGILGTGKIASIFAQGLAHASLSRLVAVGSRDATRAAVFAAEYGATNAHGSYEALISDPEVEFIHIATPHSTHVELAIEAARAGKHVLCEKPLAVDAAGASQMVAGAASHRTFLMEAFAFRCHPQTQRLIALVASGEIGELRSMNAAFGYDAGPAPTNYLLRRELAGGSILDVGCYTVAFARLLAGQAEGHRFRDPVRLEGAGFVDPLHGVDLDASAIAWFDGGFVAQLSSSIRTNLDSTVEITGVDGFVRVPAPWLPGKHGGPPRIVINRHGESTREIEVETTADLYAIEADAVVRNARQGRLEAAEMSWADSVGNMQTLDRWRAAVGVRYDGEPARIRVTA